ncbi:MAG: hypothetical protein VW394_06630 [Candidatus Heimdallarchaeota archaeon]
MSSYEKYVNSEIGRTFLISGLMALILGYLTIIIPLADTVSTDPWYSFLYNDVTIAEEDRFNVFLVILETLFFVLFYFFFTIALASYKEINDQIPSWGQLFYAGSVTILGSLLIPQLDFQGNVEGTGSGSGYNHFTSSMQTWVAVMTIVGVVLVSLYIYYTETQKSKN